MARVINVQKHHKQVRKADRRRDVAKLLGLARAFPLIISDSRNNPLALIEMIKVGEFIPRLSGSVRVQEKEAFDRLF